MNEEEIIKYIKDEIENETDTYHWFDDMPKNKTRKQIEESINAHQGLLELYQKQKEKVKELENADLTVVYMDGFYDGKKKIENKIKEKIEELEKEQEQNRKELASGIDYLSNKTIDAASNKIVINMSIREYLQDLLK